LLTFFAAAAAKKVSAAPHRGEANRPIRKQGKANAAGKQPKPRRRRQPDHQEIKESPTPGKGKPNTWPNSQSAAQAKTKRPPEPYNDERTAADPLENARTPE
jgi:hypothetical protein